MELTERVDAPLPPMRGVVYHIGTDRSIPD